MSRTTIHTDGKYMLDNSCTSWVTTSSLSTELQTYAEQNFDVLFDLQPREPNQVYVRGANRDVHRRYKSYLKSPKWNKHLEHSYMFSKVSGAGENPSGADLSDADQSLPDEFKPFHNFMNQEENKYDQVIANWYKTGEDYIAFHADCEEGMKNNADISVLSINKDGHAGNFRTFVIKPKGTTEDSVHDYVFIKMKHGCVVTMGGDCQKKFRHSIPRANSSLLNSSLLNSSLLNSSLLNSSLLSSSLLNSSLLSSSLLSSSLLNSSLLSSSLLNPSPRISLSFRSFA
jgi:alkylated DNA repair dioxygenase AlkB